MASKGHRSIVIFGVILLLTVSIGSLQMAAAQPASGPYVASVTEDTITQHRSAR